MIFLTKRNDNGVAVIDGIDSTANVLSLIHPAFAGLTIITFVIKQIINYIFLSNIILKKYKREKINYNNIHSAADILLCHFAYIYDYNFSTMLKFVDSKGYIDKMYNRFSFEDDITEERYKNIYLHTKTYIKKKTG